MATTFGVLMLVLGAGCPYREPPVRAPLRKLAKEFKVLTFNVNWGGPHKTKAAAAILRTGADLVALQETTRAWEAFLRPRLSKKYPTMLFRHAGGAGGMAFLSRYPIRDHGTTLPPRGGWFFAWHVEARTPNGTVHLLNVHLRPPLGNSGRTSTVVSGYFSTKRVRLSEIEHHMAHVRSNRPLIVLGDFNENKKGLAVRWLQDRGFKSALPRFDRKTPTWRWPTSIYTFRSRLDHIFYSKGLRCVGAQVVGPSGSDHYPVEAVFTFRR